MKKIITTAALSLAALALAGCGSDAGTTDAPEEVAPITPEAVEPVAEETTEPAEDENLSDRGNLIMKTGDTGVVSDAATGDEFLQFTVKSIKPVTCTGEYAEPAENGNLYAVDLSAVTKDVEVPVMISSYSFTYFNDKGTRFNGDLGTMATYSCVDDSELIPSDIGPGEKVTGKVVLDLPAKHGTLVFEPTYDEGFEYTY
jgi:hypothetical protein